MRMLSTLLIILKSLWSKDPEKIFSISAEYGYLSRKKDSKKSPTSSWRKLSTPNTADLDQEASAAKVV